MSSYTFIGASPYPSMSSPGNEVFVEGLLDSYRRLHGESSTKEHEALGGIASRNEGKDLTISRLVYLPDKAKLEYAQYGGATYRIPSDLVLEWPEVVAIHRKLVRGVRLDERDELWVREIAEASGWSIDDVVDEIRNIDVDPSERIERYRDMFERYYREAVERMKRGDREQAGEKLWGAITALIKLYASAKGVAVIHWSMRKLDSFVQNNVDERYRKLFRDLLDKAHILHEYFYEKHLDPKGFEERWGEVIELLDRVRGIVFKSTTVR